MNSWGEEESGRRGRWGPLKRPVARIEGRAGLGSRKTDSAKSRPNAAVWPRSAASWRRSGGKGGDLVRKSAVNGMMSPIASSGCHRVAHYSLSDDRSSRLSSSPSSPLLLLPVASYVSQSITLPSNHVYSLHRPLPSL